MLREVEQAEGKVVGHARPLGHCRETHGVLPFLDRCQTVEADQDPMNVLAAVWDLALLGVGLGLAGALGEGRLSMQGGRDGEEGEGGEGRALGKFRGLSDASHNLRNQ